MTVIPKTEFTPPDERAKGSPWVWLIIFFLINKTTQLTTIEELLSEVLCCMDDAQRQDERKWSRDVHFVGWRRLPPCTAERVRAEGGSRGEGGARPESRERTDVSLWLVDDGDAPQPMAADHETNVFSPLTPGRRKWSPVVVYV